MTTVGAICTQIGTRLNDPGFVTFTKAGVLYQAINNAVNSIVLSRPDATAVVKAITLAASPRQSVPDGGYKFLNLTRNLGVGGSIPGKVIRKIKRAVLDEMVPDWPTETTTTRIEHFIFDDELPRVFWVYPAPSIATLQAEIVYSEIPAAVSDDNNIIGLPDSFMPALIEWVLWECYSMESDGASIELGAYHLNAFSTLLGLKLQGDQLLSQVQEEK